EKCQRVKEETDETEEQMEVQMKKLESQNKEKEHFKKHSEQKQKAIYSIETAMITSENTINKLDIEIGIGNSMIKRMRHLIDQLETDLSKAQTELNIKKLQENQLQEMSIDKETRITQIKEQITAAETELKNQKVNLEIFFVYYISIILFWNRNAYNRTLVDQKEEMQEFKRKFTATNHEILQLKLELQEKEQVYVQEHFEVDQVNKDTIIIKSKIESMNKKIRDGNETIEKQLASKKNFQQMVSDREETMKRLQRQYEAIMNEQRLLTAQLVLKNKEITQVHQHLELLDCTFSTNKTTYKQDLQNLQTCKQDIYDTNKQIDKLENDIQNVDNLKSLIHAIENDLLQEELKIQALTTELEQPRNVHRWRQLKDTNPHMFALIEKTQQLNRQLLKQSEQLEQKMNEIEKQEKLYVNLRRVLARQPGSEAREQLIQYAQSLKEKKEKFKLIQAELCASQDKVDQFNHTIYLLNKDLFLLKIEFFQFMQQNRQKKHFLQENTPQIPFIV
ncbi:flagellar associated protein, partial [Reticulomyxa filosa]